MSTTTQQPGGELLAGINHVATVTADLDRLEAFYEQAFDASVVRRWDGDERHSMIRLGPSTVLHAFERCDKAPVAKQAMFQRGRLDHIGINAASRQAFDGLRERLVCLGASDGSVTQFPTLSSVHFVDPDGMELELCWQEPTAHQVREAAAGRRGMRVTGEFEHTVNLEAQRGEPVQASSDPGRRRSKVLRDQADIELHGGDVADPNAGW